VISFYLKRQRGIWLNSNVLLALKHVVYTATRSTKKRRDSKPSLQSATIFGT